MPPAGRYNAGQKLLFWSFFIGAILLLASGVVLWFTESLPWSLRWVRYISVVVHAGTALLLIGNFMIHIYMGVFAERGAFDSVISGDVSLAFAKRYHPGWYKEIGRDLRPLEMTILSAGKVNYRARIERAALLAEQHVFAREILSFYGAIAKFQREFYESLPKRWGKKPVVPANGDLRSELNLPVLLDSFAEFLKILEAHARKLWWKRRGT